MSTEEIKNVEPIAAPKPALTHPEKPVLRNAVADKYAATRDAKKKKKRRAHRITIRRSHSNG